MAEVTIHPEAEAEYEHALAWYLDRSPQAAERFDAAFDQAIKDIQTHPTLFPSCDGIRRFVTLKPYPYILIDRVDG